MNMLLHNPLFMLLVIVAIIGFLIYRQITPRKISQKSLIIFPLIILYFLIESSPSFHPTQKQLIEISISTFVSTILGLLATRQLHVYEGKMGKAMAKGSWTYFLWWLSALVVKSLLAIMFGETSLHTVSQFELLLPIFVLIVTRNAYLYWKVIKLQLQFH